MNPEHSTTERSTHDLVSTATPREQANDPAAGGTTDPRWQFVFILFLAVTVMVAGPADRLKAAGAPRDTKRNPAMLRGVGRVSPQ